MRAASNLPVTATEVGKCSTAADAEARHCSTTTSWSWMKDRRLVTSFLPPLAPPPPHLASSSIGGTPNFTATPRPKSKILPLMPSTSSAHPMPGSESISPTLDSNPSTATLGSESSVQDYESEPEPRQSVVVFLKQRCKEMGRDLFLVLLEKH